MQACAHVGASWACVHRASSTSACRGIIGMGLVAEGNNAVTWHSIDRSEKFPIKGLSAIVLSWIVSPLLSGIVSAGLFWTTRTVILRASNSYDRAFWYLPLLVALCAFINAFYVLDKGINQQCVPSATQTQLFLAEIAHRSSECTVLHFQAQRFWRHMLTFPCSAHQRVKHCRNACGNGSLLSLASLLSSCTACMSDSTGTPCSMCLGDECIWCMLGI
jgi:phosphate/sulfate permease